MSRRGILWLAGGAVMLLLGGAVAWWLRPAARQQLWTDADTIRVAADEASPRDVLWQPPSPLSELINTGAEDYEPRWSWDGSTLYFVRGRAGENADIYFSQRTPEGWTQPARLEIVNSEYDDLGPEPTRDGKRLYFYSNRPGGAGGYDLYVSERGPQGWLEPVNLGPTVNSDFNDYGPAVSPGGERLVFASNRPRPEDSRQPDPDAWPATVREDLFHRTYDLYKSQLTSRGPSQAAALDTLNSPYNEGAPCFSPGGDFLYFGSDRPGGLGGFDLYRAWIVAGDVREPRNLDAPVNSAANELDPGLAQLGFALVFSSDRPMERVSPERPNDYDLYYTTTREVFPETELLARPPFDWAGLWQSILPNLLWLLLALLLLLLLLLLWRDADRRKLSLLARCLLASLMAHLLLMLLLNFWKITAKVAEIARERGSIQVALISPSADAITQQIMASLTQLEPTRAAMQAVERMEVAVERPAQPESVRLEVEPAAAVSSEALQVEPAAREAPLPEIEPTQSLSPSVELAAYTRAMAVETPVIENAPTAQAEPVVEPDVAAVPETDRSPVVPRSATLDAGAVRGELPALRRAAVEAEAVELAAGELPVREADTPQVALTGDAPRLVPAELTTPATLNLRTPQVAERTAENESESAVELVAAAAPAAGRAAVPVRETAANVNDAIPSSLSPAQLDSARRAIALDATPDVRDAELAEHRPEPPAPNSVTQPAPAATMTLAVAGPKLPDSSPPAEAEAEALPAAMIEAPTVERSQPRLDLAHAATRNSEPSAQQAPPIPSSPTKLATDAPTLPASFSASVTDAAVAPPLAASAAAPSVELAAADIRPLDLRLPPVPVLLPEAFAQRSPARRDEVLRQRGGDERTEKAVRDALRWLAAHQSADGSWNGGTFDRDCGRCDGRTEYDVDVALTGLSLLCFLGAGHTHVAPGPYQDNVQRAIEWLVQRQRADGDLRDGETMYSHGIATIALAEALGMTEDRALRAPVQRAAEFIVAAQNPRTGGWRYDPGDDGDTSVLGWQVMALKSAQNTGFELSAGTITGIQRWLSAVEDRGRPGLYGYQPGDPVSESMTAEATFVRQLLGAPRDDASTQRALVMLSGVRPAWPEDANSYLWYYATLMHFHHGGEPWERWNAALRPVLLAGQEKSGPVAGSWPVAGEWAEIGGRIYQTALCTLMLEVYYRYLPLHANPAPPDVAQVLQGTVREAESGRPIERATIRLDVADGEPLLVQTDAAGRYSILAPRVPDHFAISASHPGYVPRSLNVPAEQVRRTGLTVDFSLEPQKSDVVVIEATPEVHHLGNDRFTGRVNSQFQKPSEGRRLRAYFELSAAQLETRRVVLTMLTKGVQCPHPLELNGATLDEPLGLSPRDGSFGEFSVRIDPELLREGENELVIQTSSCQGDLDDFEFVNVQIHFGGE